MMQRNSKLDWQQVYGSYAPKLLGICRRYIPDVYTAEDIVHDSFITAMQKNHQLNDEKAVFAWLKTIVVNNALQYIRKHSKDTFVAAEPSELPDTQSAMDHHFQEEKNVLIYDFTREELLSSIDSLPAHHKSVFNLYFIENFSHAEISRALGITVNTSKSHLLRAKKAVQKYLLDTVDNSTHKRKMAQLMVILGFGGLLWAQTFKSSFAGFTIQPSKKLDIPNGSYGNALPVRIPHRLLTRKIITGSGIAGIAVTAAFIVATKSPLQIHRNPVSSNPVHPQDGSVSIKTHTTLDHDRASISTTEESYGASQNQVAESRLPDDEMIPADTKAAATEKAILFRKTEKKKAPADSADDTPQKIMIVRKIIKRDTLFIER